MGPRRFQRFRDRSGPRGRGADRASLRRAQVSFAAIWASESAFMVALGVVAFRDGGVVAVGAVTAARMAAAALLAPFLATVADRVRRERVLVGVGVVRAALLGGIAVVTAAGGPTAVIYSLAVVATVAHVACSGRRTRRCCRRCVKSPRQLTSANAVRGMLDSLRHARGTGARGGPAGGERSRRAVFAACAGRVAAGRPGRRPAPLRRPAASRRPRAAPAARCLQGFATIAAERSLALITGLGVAQTFTRGCLSVFAVVVAIDLLGTGDAGVGVLTRRSGPEGCSARCSRSGWSDAAGSPMVRRRRRAVRRAAGADRRRPRQAAAIGLLGVVGIGNALIDVGGFTLLARLADETVLARMFAGFEAILTLGVAAGGLVAPLVIELLGVRVALVVDRPARPAGRGRQLARAPPARRDDARARRGHRDHARASDMLSALPVTTIEQLAGGLEHAELGPGETVFRQGEPGDYFYVVSPAARR